MGVHVAELKHRDCETDECETFLPSTILGVWEINLQQRYWKG
jgi:hypothetical protein